MKCLVGVIKFLTILFLLIFFGVPLLFGVAINAAYSAELTKLEQSYIDDSFKAFYIRVLNNNCHFKPATEANAMTDDVGDFAKTVLGEDRFTQHAASAKSRQIIGKFLQLDKRLESLSKLELNKVCANHKKEFNNIYKYLVSQSDESGESEDN